MGNIIRLKKHTLIGAVVILLSIVGNTVWAVGVCTPSGAPKQLRAEGSVEVLGAIVLNCKGIVVTRQRFCTN